MGKKVKKKTRSGHKEKKVSSVSPKNTSQQSIVSSIETTDNGNTVVKDKRVCPHVEKGVNLEKLSAKFGSSESLKCEYCRIGGDGRGASKGKAKQGKKKGGAESRLESKAIWVCLECGHFSCGGVGLPTTPQTHAIRHSRQDHHLLAIQFENPQLRWCFSCNMLIPAEKSGEGVEHKNVFHEVVKMMKLWPSECPALDAEDVWFGNGSVASGIISKNSEAVGSGGRGRYSVLGLVNLGNTCFFNSVMQNLLALYRLRDYFCKLDGSVGPLTAALKKLIVEANPDSGLRNVINPRSFFGCICAKAPQFRGYQQQDSHELLRCLLDGLSTEELSARKQNKSSQENGNSAPTFVDAIFGGQLLSTVTCLECGHSSLVYEPFLDLSLPVPTKRPPAKKAQPVTRAKKHKPHPRRNAKLRPKINRDTLPSASTSDVSVGGKSSCLAQSSTNVPEQNAVSSGDSALLVSTDASIMADSKSIASHSLSPAHSTECNQVIENVVEKPTPADDFTWLDFLEADTGSNDNNVTSQMDDLSVNHGSADENAVQNSVALKKNSECSGDNISTCTKTECCSFKGLWLEHHEQEKLLDVQYMALHINEKLGLEDSEIMDAVQSEVNWGNGSESGGLTCPRHLNLGVDSSGKFSEEETPLVVQDSEVLLLPYKEDTLITNEVLKTEGEFSSSALDKEQDSLEFEGFGDLFNEPEAAIPSMKPSSIDNTSEVNEVVQAVFSSESEPDEVDNMDAPASVESCLSYFTKSELLSKSEHAWQCENCSKVLREQRMRLSRKFQNPVSENVIDRGVDTRTSGLSHLTEYRPLSSVVEHLCNGNLNNDTVDGSDDGFLSHDGKRDGKLNFILGTGERADLNPVASRMEDIKWEVDLAPVCTTEYSGGDKNYCKLDKHYKNGDGCHVEGYSFDANTDGNVQNEGYPAGSARCQSEGSEVEEKNSKIEKMERDATKRILINRAPPILTIHLKRFSQDARGRLSKLNGYVQFNHTLDLKPYMDPRCMDKDKYKYNLVGVVEHLGTMRGGHYVAYVRGGMKTTGKAENENGDYVWYHASDAYVHEVSIEEVLRSEAYILFYERI